MKYVQPFDQPSNPNAPFIDLNAATGTDGSIPPAKFFNDVQAEILTVISGAGLTPNAADLTQLRQAILAMIPTPTGGPSDASLIHWGADTGAQNALAVTPTPGFLSLAAGFTLWTVPAFSNNGAATISLTPTTGSAIVRNIRRRDGSALQEGDIVAGQLTALVVDSTGVFRLHRDKTGLIGLQIFTTSTTYNPTFGARTIIAIATGGGGAGGSSNGVAGLCGGGGESGSSWIYIGPPSSQFVAVGGGGAPASPSAAMGTKAGFGGQSSFGSLAIAPGGQGGWNSVGAGPMVSGTYDGSGWFPIRSGGGGAPFANSWNGVGMRGGDGGSTIWGGGGSGSDANASGSGASVPMPGYNAYGWGGGGGGGDSGAVSAVSGGYGHQGVVMVFEFA